MVGFQWCGPLLWCSDYHTGFTGRFNIYDLVLEKPFFKGTNNTAIL
jgi:hypothetical protein